MKLYRKTPGEHVLYQALLGARSALDRHHGTLVEQANILTAMNKFDALAGERMLTPEELESDQGWSWAFGSSSHKLALVRGATCSNSAVRIGDVIYIAEVSSEVTLSFSFWNMLGRLSDGRWFYLESSSQHVATGESHSRSSVLVGNTCEMVEQARTQGPGMTPLEELLNDPDWNDAFDVSNDNSISKHVCRVEGALCSEVPALITDVVHIEAISEGERDCDPWMLFGRLRDGRWFYLEAGCCYTGWDVQGEGTMAVGDTKDMVEQFGLTNKARDEFRVKDSQLEEPPEAATALDKLRDCCFSHNDAEVEVSFTYEEVRQAWREIENLRSTIRSVHAEQDRYRKFGDSLGIRYVNDDTKDALQRALSYSTGS